MGVAAFAQQQSGSAPPMYDGGLILPGDKPAQQAPAQQTPTQTPTQPAPQAGQTGQATPAPSGQTQPQNQVSTGAPTDNVPAPPSQPANQGGSSVAVQPPRGQDIQKEGGEFVLRKRVEEVTLHATVIDDRQRLVTDLNREAFQVFENGQPQKLTSFRREDVPVALGIVIDNSGSMRDKRPAVNQAAINLVRSSNPDDKVFIVNFNNEPYLDQDFTANVDQMRDALDRIESRGGTALYDSVVAAAKHLMTARDVNEKKVILVVTDGEDNASRESLEAAVRFVSVDGGPTVYSIGLLGGEKEKRARRALRILAEQTGGVSFFPKDLSEVDNITRQIAHDIRNQYILQYAPSEAKTTGGYRTVRVEARAPGYKRLQVRTRTGYYANEQQRASK